MYSQQHEEQIVVDWFKDRPVGQYLDIGAWDGVQMSNTRRLAELGWRGVLVEPGAKNFSELINNYAFAADRTVLIQAAVSETRGLARLWFDTHPGNSWSVSICKEIADNPLMMPTRSGMHCVVPTITPADLEQFGAFSFLSLDAEGKDMEILRAMPDSMFEPMSMICAEVLPQWFDEALALLAPKGFREHSRTAWNAFFVK